MENKVEVVRQLVESTNGKFFTVKFIKKDGEPRTITGRINVSKDTKGGAAGWRANPDNMGVYEINTDQYRAFNASRVTYLKINNQEYNF